MVKGEDNVRLVPELYTVEADKVEAEYQEPGSQQRQAIGRCPFLWAQSLYILGNLLQDVCHNFVCDYLVYLYCATVI